MQRVAHERVCKLFEHQVPRDPRLVRHTDYSSNEVLNEVLNGLGEPLGILHTDL
jgi:hypothetical protein